MTEKESTQPSIPPTHASSWNMETLFVHAGRPNESEQIKGGTPTVRPIYASTTFTHENVEALDQAFEGVTADGEPAFAYARQGNPGASAFEEIMAKAEQGVGAVVNGSGMAAIQVALQAAGLTRGTKIVASQDLFGPTINLLRRAYVPNGVELVLLDLCSPEGIERARAEEPDVIFVETISNPLTKIIDLDAISAVAQEVGAISIVDNTFATPYLVRPIEHGIDLVMHSATKYIGGHGDSTAGVVVSAKRALLDQLRTFNSLFGAMLSPFDIHLMLRGLRTMVLRVDQQCDNAAQVARFLQQHPAVANVYYPGLSTHPQHSLAGKLLKDGLYGGLLSFEVKEQSRAATMRFLNALQLCVPATSLGDVFTLVSYPLISSHRVLSPAERSKMGITDGCVRVSVGIEHVTDIIQDLDQALKS
jgi:cystathionine beta-lyase/cystathionine gamma-synthase